MILFIKFMKTWLWLSLVLIAIFIFIILFALTWSKVRIGFKLGIRNIDVIVKFTVRGWKIFYAFVCPHKDSITMMCARACERVKNNFAMNEEQKTWNRKWKTHLVFSQSVYFSVSDVLHLRCCTAPSWLE